MNPAGVTNGEVPVLGRFLVEITRPTFATVGLKACLRGLRASEITLPFRPSRPVAIGQRGVSELHQNAASTRTHGPAVLIGAQAQMQYTQHIQRQLCLCVAQPQADGLIPGWDHTQTHAPPPRVWAVLITPARVG